MKKVTVLVFYLLFAGGAVAGQKLSLDGLFQRPIVTEGAEGSIVARIESAIIIPGDTHEALWVHPNLVTIPGEPIVVELALRSTDRRGRDRHTAFNYFRSEDYFRSLHWIAEPKSRAWKRIGLTPKDLAAPRRADFQVPEAPVGEWHWARNWVYIDSQRMLQPFLVRRGDRRSVQTLVARLEEGRIVPMHLSNTRTNDTGRGLLEPQIARFGERFFMTVRAEDGRGYVLVSGDGGRSWSRPRAWRWDDGEVIAMRSTMTKLLSHSEGLVLVYTRVREDNKDVFRRRAPLHCADVDPETLAVRRASERVVVPNRGWPVGNFWVWPVDPECSYVAVGEWPRDGRAENGDVWLAKIYWKRANRQMTSVGHERAAMR